MSSEIRNLKRWVIDSALPFWASEGFDYETSLFKERLSFNGHEIRSQPRRALVQARQIYVYCHAAIIGWFPDGAELAIRATDALLSRFRVENNENSFVFSINLDGSVADGRKDTYSHAFILFALAWAYKLEKSDRFRRAADGIFRMIDTDLSSREYGGYIDGDDRVDAVRRQNPHMHLFEACLAWYEASSDAAYLSRAGEIFGLFTTRFFQPEYGTLSEYFGKSWMPKEGKMGHITEPGHHMEWVWLLRKYETLTGRSVNKYCDPLFCHALEYGRSVRGLFFDEVLDEGTVVTKLHRTWPHTEALKAAAAEHEAGRENMGLLAENFAGLLMNVFVQRPFSGGWIDHVNDSMDTCVDFVPASTLYHLVLAAAESERVFG